MSLIVDINPVPWEILEQVKARLLKNRAKKQKRQPEKGKELRRVMQVDNGILAKQRWEEPSFIGADRVFAIVFGGWLVFDSSSTSMVPTSYTVKVNGSAVGNVINAGLLNRIERHIFIWSSSEEDLNEVIKLNPYIGEEIVINTVTVVETEPPDPEEVAIVELSNIVHAVFQGNVYPPVFSAAFYLDNEYTKIIRFFKNPNGGSFVNIEDTTLTYPLENWKPS